MHIRHLLDTLRRRIYFGARIGLSVIPEWVGAVIVRRSGVVWSIHEAIGPDATLETVVQSVLQRALTSGHVRWPRPRVWVAIEAARSRVKTIRGLPAVDDPRLVAQLLAATPDRFFIGNMGGLVVTGARILAPGVAEAAAFDAATLGEIQRGCAAVGVEPVLFVPASVAIAEAPNDGPPPAGDENLSAADGEAPAPEFAAALGATRVSYREAIVVRHAQTTSMAGPGHRRRLIVAGLVAAVAMTAMLVTPAVIAMHTARAARHVIATLAPARAKALSAERDVAEMTVAIATVGRFETHRSAKTLLLLQLTQALPAGATITAFTADTAGTTVTVLAAHAADVVRAIEEMLGTSHVEMIGPVTREFVPASSTPVAPSAGATAQMEVERVTVRFQSAAEDGTARQPLGDPE